MTDEVQFDSGDDATTRALMARARGEHVGSVLPAEELQRLESAAAQPEQLQSKEQSRKAA